jgi:hypothetical protein
MKQIYTESVLEKLSMTAFQNAEDYLEGPQVDFSELRSILTDLTSLNDFRKIGGPLKGKHFDNNTVQVNPGKLSHFYGRIHRWSGKRRCSCLYYATDLYEFEVRTECPEVRIELGRCYYKA